MQRCSRLCWDFSSFLGFFAGDFKKGKKLVRGTKKGRKVKQNVRGIAWEDGSVGRAGWVVVSFCVIMEGMIAVG